MISYVFRFLIVLILLTAGFAKGFAQDSSAVMKKTKTPTKRYEFVWGREDRKNIIQWNFLSTFVLAVNFSYERSLSRHTSLLAGGYWGKYMLTSRGDSLPFDTDIVATGGYVEFKIFPFGKGPRGAYLAPYGAFRFFKLKSPYITSPPGQPYTYGVKNAESFNLSGGLTVGYRWILGNWFVVNPYFGAGYNESRFHFFGNAQKSDFNTRLIFVDRYELRVGLNLGIALK